MDYPSQQYAVASIRFKCTEIIVGGKGFGLLTNILMLGRFLHRIHRILSVRKNGYKNSPLRHIYEAIISAAEPRAVIAVEGSQYLALACRNSNTRHFELLHGYGFSGKDPWGWKYVSPDLLAQNVVAFDQLTYETLKQKENSYIRIWKAVHPYTYLNRETTCSITEGTRKKKILITLQWGYNGDSDGFNELNNKASNGFLADQLVEVMKDRNVNDCYDWYIRFHPIQNRDPKRKREASKFLNSLRKQNIAIITDSVNDVPLQEIASSFDGHITMSSCSCYEMALYGVKTLTLDTNLTTGRYTDLYIDLSAEGYLERGVTKVSDIKKWLTSLSKAKFRNMISDDESGYIDIAKLIV